jgi:hypothetical protein
MWRVAQGVYCSEICLVKGLAFWKATGLEPEPVWLNRIKRRMNDSDGEVLFRLASHYDFFVPRRHSLRQAKGGALCPIKIEKIKDSLSP